MRVHSTDKIKKLEQLRRKGYSINELVAELSIPKTTVWYHIQGVRVVPKYIPILKAKQGGSAKRTKIYWQKARDRAQELLRGEYRELAIVVSILYWGEGSKRSCEFINSDGRMIQTYLFALRKVFNVQEKDIKPTLRIFSGMNRSECLNYWSKITRIPKHRFIIRFNDGSTRGKTKYGMCRITIKKGGNFLKLIQSLIDQFYEEKIIKR